MQQAIHWTIVFPVLLQLLQASLLLIMSMTILRQRKLLVDPIGGMDYARVIFCASVLLGVLIIASGSTPFMFRAFKAIQDGSIRDVLIAFSKFFVTSFVAAALFLGVTFIILNAITFGKSDNSIMSGSIPTGIIIGAVALGLSIVVSNIAAPVYEWLTPVYLNFR